VRYEHFADEAALLDTVAEHLDQGKVIGWFNGRMEFGRGRWARAVSSVTRATPRRSRR